MADLSKVKIGTQTYDLKDASARSTAASLSVALASEQAARISGDAALSSAITAESVARASADDALDIRIKNLEARGRFLSNWNASTGVPEDYPKIPAGATSPYVYEYKSGDYYIVGTVAASGSTNYQPSGASITATKSGDTWSWEVGKAEFANEVGIGDYFICSNVSEGTATWVHVSNSQKTVTFANIQGSPYANSSLSIELNLKADKATTIAGLSIGDNISKVALQSALDLENLAFSDTASGSVSFTPAGTISEVDATPAGTVTVTLSQSDTAATVHTGSYTPAGTVSGDAIKGGTINVTLKDASAQTDATVTSAAYVPAGEIKAEATFSAIKSVAFASSDTGTIQIQGEVSKPDINLTSTSKTVVTGITGGSVAEFDVAKFSGGSFTGATQASFTQGAKASFSQGAKAALTDQTTSVFAKEGILAAVGTGDDKETLIFTAATTANAVTDRGTFTANGDDTFTANGDDSFTANEVGTFSAAAMASDIFTPNVLQTVTSGTVNDVTGAALAATPVFTGAKYNLETTSDTAIKTASFTATNSANIIDSVKYTKQVVDEHTFTGTAASLSFVGTADSSLRVTDVSYNKASVSSASFSGTANKITPTFTGSAATLTVVVRPDEA